MHNLYQEKGSTVVFPTGIFTKISRTTLKDWVFEDHKSIHAMNVKKLVSILSFFTVSVSNKNETFAYDFLGNKMLNLMRRRTETDKTVHSR